MSRRERRWEFWDGELAANMTNTPGRQRRGALLHGGQCHCNQIVREPIGYDKHN
jgi:hypothetical protein